MPNARAALSFIAIYYVCMAALCPQSVHAQTTATEPPTLADALKIVAPPDPGTVILTVNGDQVNPPSDAPPLGNSPYVQTIADDFGRIAPSFGEVTAIAPATMVLLNTAPSDPDISANLGATDAFTLLVASLTDSEWNELISEQGLPISELNTDWQKKLLPSLFSKDGKLLIRPHYRYDEKPSDSDLIDATDSIPDCSLRMGQTIEIQLPIKGENRAYFGLWTPPADGAREWDVSDRQDYGGSSDVAYGSQVRAVVPNVSKQSQLDYSAPDLQRTVSLDGVKTVGDLFARISAVSHIELYADPRLDQSLQTVGAQSATASDLLQAVALCQTATYRQVGPAYVLTDDVIGVGSRRELWYEFDQVADGLRRKPIEAAANLSYKERSPKDIPWFGDPTQYTPAQALDWGHEVPDPKMLPVLHTTFDELTPAQQAMAQREEDDWNGRLAAGIGGGQPITTDGAIGVEPEIKVVLIVPGITDPVDMNLSYVGLPDSVVFQAGRPAQRIEKSAKQPSAPTPEGLSAAVAALANGTADRAVLVHPRTTVGVDADIAAMKALGLNQMWLDVFSDGQAHIPGSSLSVLPHKLKPGENDILTEAVVKGKAAGIAIYAVMDLFYWGASPSADVTDRNILGETSAQEEASWNQREAVLPSNQQTSDMFSTSSIVPIFPGIAVAPTHPAVRSALLGLARAIAHHPGVAGIVMRDTDPPGYDLAPGNMATTPDLQLGFSLPGRLAFLRKYHADPIDLYPAGGYSGIANTNLPNFDDNNYPSGRLTDDLWTKWAKFRRAADIQLMDDLYRYASPAGAASSRTGFTVIIKQRRRPYADRDALGRMTFGAGWYGSWDSVANEPPTLRGAEETGLGEPYQSEPPAGLQATLQSRHVYTPISRQMLNRPGGGFGSAPKPPPGAKMQVSFGLKSGYVLDLSDDPFGDNGNGSDPLTNLVSEMAGKLAVSPPAPAAGGSSK